MADKRITEIVTDNLNPTRGDSYAVIDHATRGTEKASLRAIHGGGFFDYNDAATAITPISPSTGVWTKLTNDTLGPNTVTAYSPAGVTSLWDSVANQFDFSQLSMGDQFQIRIDVSATTTSANQQLEMRMVFGIGSGSQYEIEFQKGGYKTAGLQPIVRYVGYYIGNTATKDFPAELQIKSDGSLSVVNNGIYIKVDRY